MESWPDHLAKQWNGGSKVGGVRGAIFLKDVFTCCFQHFFGPIQPWLYPFVYTCLYIYKLYISRVKAYCILLSYKLLLQFTKFWYYPSMNLTHDASCRSGPVPLGKTPSSSTSRFPFVRRLKMEEEEVGRWFGSGCHVFLVISSENKENQEGRKEAGQDDNKQEETWHPEDIWTFIGLHSRYTCFLTVSIFLDVYRHFCAPRVLQWLDPGPNVRPNGQAQR